MMHGDAAVATILPGAKILYLESPTSWLMRAHDIRALAARLPARRLPTSSISLNPRYLPSSFTCGSPDNPCGSSPPSASRRAPESLSIAADDLLLFDPAGGERLW